MPERDWRRGHGQQVGAICVTSNRHIQYLNIYTKRKLSVLHTGKDPLTSFIYLQVNASYIPKAIVLAIILLGNQQLIGCNTIT